MTDFDRCFYNVSTNVAALVSHLLNKNELKISPAQGEALQKRLAQLIIAEAKADITEAELNSRCVKGALPILADVLGVELVLTAPPANAAVN